MPPLQKLLLTETRAVTPHSHPITKRERSTGNGHTVSQLCDILGRPTVGPAKDQEPRGLEKEAVNGWSRRYVYVLSTCVLTFSYYLTLLKDNWTFKHKR